MEEEDQTRPRELRYQTLLEIHGMISASRIDSIIQKIWWATGDIMLLRELLEWEIQERPEIRRVLERVLEIEGKLVTTSGIVTPF